VPVGFLVLLFVSLAYRLIDCIWIVYVVRDVLSVVLTQLDRDIFIDRAGVRLFFGDAQFGEPLQYFVSFDFQFPCQLVDSNLLHRESNLLLPADSPPTRR
jgi:hypothetical protein